VFGLGLFGPGCGHISEACVYKNEPRFSLKGRENFDSSATGSDTSSSWT
jgi:hypothetical protein